MDVVKSKDTDDVPAHEVLCKLLEDPLPKMVGRRLLYGLSEAEVKRVEGLMNTV